MMNHLHGYELENAESRLDDINQSLVAEADSEKRNVFMILQSHALIMQKQGNALSKIANVLEEQSGINTIKINTHEERLLAHDKINLRNDTAFKIFAAVLSSLQVALIGFFMYGYSLVATMRDQVNEQSVLLPRIEAMANESRQQRQVINYTQQTVDANKDHIEQQKDVISAQDEKIDSIDSDVTMIKRKKVIKASR